MSIGAALRVVVGGRTLTAAEMTAAFEEIVDGSATPAQIAGFAVALRMRGESAEEVAAAAEVMRRRMTRVDVGVADHVDTCGTGGDGAGTFNISTTAAFVVAACGVPVAKHGNRSVSSQSGSADVLAELGVNIEAPLADVKRAIAEIGVGFLFAPLYHGALKSAAAPRKELGIRTFFNLLGPLANPAGAAFQVMGIYDGKSLETVARALRALGTKGALVVHGDDGLDEITLTTTTRLARVTPQGVTLESFDPRTLGLALCTSGDLAGGTPAENAAITRAILAGERSPRRDATALNAAAALIAARRGDWVECLKAANHAIDSGAAEAKLGALVAFEAGGREAPPGGGEGNSPGGGAGKP